MSFSTHVLDTTTGRPASGVAVELWHETDSGAFALTASGVTDSDGRIGGWRLRTGRYRLEFGTGAWWREHGVQAFHPEVVVAFLVADPNDHHHVPLLLSPFAYSTYRGS